ncbi:hypothetical protein K523DRAFT_167281 [Schizophyllum commune Tattone D]|nr:hypothetical protein K523DRAFT_167281 [Schizophyllum commune Tattone D]
MLNHAPSMFLSTPPYHGQVARVADIYLPCRGQPSAKLGHAQSTPTNPTDCTASAALSHLTRTKHITYAMLFSSAFPTFDLRLWSRSMLLALMRHRCCKVCTQRRTRTLRLRDRTREVVYSGHPA